MTASRQTVPGTRAAELAPLLQVAGQEVFRLMMGTELGHSSEVAWSGVEYTAMVGLAGELCGVLSVRCSEEASRQVAALMLDLPPEKAAEHAWDALGEVANMIAGNFKNKLNGTSDRCMLSVPTVITGADYKFRSLTVAGPVQVRFLFHGMPLVVTLELQNEI